MYVKIKNGYSASCIIDRDLVRLLPVMSLPGTLGQLHVGEDGLEG